MANTKTNKAAEKAAAEKAAAEKAAAEKAAAEKAAAEPKVQDTEAKTDNRGELFVPEGEEAKTNNRAPLFIPRGAANDEPNLIIGINGKIYTLPKGKKSMVPPEVKAEYERSVKAQERLDRTIDKLLERAKNGIGEL